VDFYSGIIYQAMGFTPDQFTVLFGIPRTVGWLAQWQEMLQDPTEDRPSAPGLHGARSARFRAAASFPGALVMANGDTLTVGPFKLEAIPMYNLKPADNGQVFHEKGRGNGYILTYGGKRFYFAGDTEGTPEMRALKNIDVAFIPMNLPYTMTPLAAADAVRAFHPAVVYPYHYRGQDTTVFAKALEGTGIEVRLRDWYAK
jgi:hypothetical protein